MKKKLKDRIWDSKLLQSLYIIFDWLVEVCAFILLPMFIYLICFKMINISVKELLVLPEWMFFTIILWGDICKRLIFLYKQFDGFEIKAVRVIALTVLGISISSIVLAFAIIGSYSDSVNLPENFGLIQLTIFIFTLFMTGYINLWVKMSFDNPLFHTMLMRGKQNKETTSDDETTPNNV